nr:hypothetical protein [Tanacetum cinerariifolium]
MFLIASRFSTPPIACAFFSPGATVTCTRCGHPVNGSYCQGCTLLREKLEKDLVTYFQNFQNTFESSDGSTNVVNAPRKPFVVKQDHGSFVDKIICDLNKAPDSPHLHTFSPNQFHCFHLFLQILHTILHKLTNVVASVIPACCDDDDDYNSAITPVLSTEEPVDSLSMGDEQLNTISATESDKVIKYSVENLVPIPSEFEGIPDTMCDMHLVNTPTPLEAKYHFEIVINPNDDISSSDDDSLYNENIEYVEASPYNSELVSLEVAEIVIPEEEEIEDDNLLFLFLEETNTFYNSLPEFKNFYFDLKEISSGNTTTHYDISLPNYEVFYFYYDHIKETSSGSTTTHSDISLSEYDSSIFDLSNDHFPPTDRSNFTHEEFADELAHIISPSEYDCFYFRSLPDPGELISILNSGISENLSSTTRVNLPVEDDHSPLLAYVVWIFLAYLTYLVIAHHLHSFRNEDTIFDPGITINHFYSFKPGLSHWCGIVKKFNTHRSHLNECLMLINGKNTPILDVPLFHFYTP